MLVRLFNLLIGLPCTTLLDLHSKMKGRATFCRNSDHFTIGVHFGLTFLEPREHCGSAFSKLGAPLYGGWVLVHRVVGRQP